MDELNFSQDELAAIRKVVAPDATDDEFTVFIAECRTRKLFPGKHVYFTLRFTNDYDPVARVKVRKRRPTTGSTIDTLRLVAQRTGQYAGQKPPQWIYLDPTGYPTIISDVPLPEHNNPSMTRRPWAARVSVFRKGFQEPITATGRFDAYAVTYSNNGTEQLNSMWSRRGPEQLAKCAESLALRQAFPEELGGLFIAEELRPDEPETVTEVIPGIVPIPVTYPVAQVPVSEPLAVVQPPSTAAPESGVEAVLPSPPTASPAEVPKSTLPEAIKEFDAAKTVLTREERSKYIERTRVYSKEILPKAGVEKPSDLVKAFILRGTGVMDAKNLTKEQWDAKLGLLDAAMKDGVFKVIEVLKGDTKS